MPPECASNPSSVGRTPFICGIRSIRRRPNSWKQGANVGYLLRKGRLTRCRNGLSKRSLADLAISVVGRPARPQDVAQLVNGRLGTFAHESPEVEILFLPGQGNFSGRAECNVLVALRADAVHPRAAKRAHLTIVPPHGTDQTAADLLSADQFEQALAAVA